MYRALADVFPARRYFEKIFTLAFFNLVSFSKSTNYGRRAPGWLIRNYMAPKITPGPVLLFVRLEVIPSLPVKQEHGLTRKTPKETAKFRNNKQPGFRAIKADSICEFF